MANILFLAHRIPYPPNKGDKIRSWNFLSRIAKHHTVHAAFFVDDEQDLKYVPVVQKVVASLCFEKVTPLFQKILSLRGFLNGTSLTEFAYPTKKLRKYCSDLISKGEIDYIFLFSAASAVMLPKECTVNMIADLVDVDSEKWKSYSKSAAWPLSLVYAREGRKLAVYEERIVTQADISILVSEDEAKVLRDHIPLLGHKILAVPNGVDTHIFDSSKYPTPPSRKSVIFTGAMDYQPNIEAVEWFCQNVWAKIKLRHPGATFTIAGGPDVVRIKKLETYEGVSVLGYVDDMAMVLSEANIVVAPLRTARGIQNKVLEALSMAKPVVATSLANEGINAQDDTHLIVANDPVPFANAVNKLLENEERQAGLGRAGRKYVQNHFSWSRSFRTLNNLILERP